MPDSGEQNTEENKVGLNRDGIRFIARDIAHSLIHLAVLLISAGKIGWINAWLLIGMSLLYQVINAAVLIKLNPQVLNKRGKLIQEDTRSFDKAFIAIYIPLAFAISIISGWDAVRYGWSDMPLAVIVIAVAVFIPTCALGTWAMAVNAHFETTVIIKESGQRVCDSGPYKTVRHPGYTGAIIGGFTYPLILGSWLGFAAAGALALLFIVRTALEDSALQKELPGYKEYANVTRYRLVPLIW